MYGANHRRDKPADTDGEFTESNSSSLSLDEFATPNVNRISQNITFTQEGNVFEPKSARRENTESHSSYLASGPDVVRGLADLEMQNRARMIGRLSTRDRTNRVVTYLFPFQQTYERLNNGFINGRLQSNAPGRFVGSGTDGVFSNLLANSVTESSCADQEQNPPTYDDAAADASPEYWETAIISPMYQDEVFVQGLPVGNFANFLWNIMVTVGFQLVGFVLCYLLHTSHSAKYGTRGGLGVTITFYGYNIILGNSGRDDRVPTQYKPMYPNTFDISNNSSITTGGVVETYSSGFFSNSNPNMIQGGFHPPLFAYLIMALGISVFFRAVTGFYSVKQDEKQILARQSTEQTHTTTEAVRSSQIA